MKFKTAMFLMLIFLSGFSQSSSQGKDKQSPKVFIDCQFCDMDFIRTEVNFVNYVYDRKNADIHIMITNRTTGSGGTEYTLTYLGQNNYQTKNDTIVFTTNNDDTADIIRKKLVKYLKIGLVPFISSTPIINDINIEYTKPKDAMIKKDRWNNWVFRTRIRGWFNGEKSSRNKYIYGSFSADRITENWKMRFLLNASYSEDKYKWEEDWIKTSRKTKGFSGTIVKSISSHWSVGGYSRINSSTFQNTKAEYRIAPAVEFNIFPYSESTRKEFRFLYTIGAKYVYYDAETIYFKTEEALFDESLEIALKFKQPWGTVETSIEGSHYLHDFSKNYLSINTDLSLRVFKGFSINLYGGISMIHNQLNLRRESPEMEDVLLRRYALETNYNYWTSIGFSYSFGSIFNNIVNPRFGGSSGRIII
ncbi:hypothetical protein DRQ07_05050 [candidate division KSB1 bacterium]|nr:MAG: hypothetical protein DRQ07_05050 [candidate division KSB1 bacterium]